MKAKWIRRSLIIGIVMLVLITATVVVANWTTIRRSLGMKQAVSETAETDPEVLTYGGGQIGDNLSEFMYDDDFFNEDLKKSDVSIKEGIKVSVMMDSVDSDLRIMVIDSFGNLVTGAKFSAEIENTGTYTDDDEDGVIYVDHLREGEYFVSLDDLDGYIVPATKTMINISGQIQYKALSDVAYLILTEDQVDTSVDDTGEKLAIKEADGTESTSEETYEDAGSIGIDVSSYNRDIDWEAVAEAGIDYAIIRCGYRGASSGSLVLDSEFKDNVNGATKAGIPIGIYFFSQATNETEAIEEASMVIDQCRLYMLDYPIYIDSESAGGDGRADGLDADTRTQIVRAFCETIANSGYEAGVYASANWWENDLNADELTLYHSWLAEYKETPEYSGYYDMWQYTSKGEIDGIETKVDLDVSYMKE